VLQVAPEVVSVLVENLDLSVQPAQLVPLPQHGADHRLAGRRQAAGANLIAVLALKSLLIYFCLWVSRDSTVEVAV
jgi:hypothetical protein